MRVAYIRVSSVDQNEERQLEALKPHKIEKYFSEKVSGKDRNRPQLRAMMDFVRRGDIVYIESISRLARNTLDFLTIVKELNAKGVQIVSLKEMIDTNTPQGKFMLTVFGALYELERENTKQRQSEGIAIALRRGVRFGRPSIALAPGFADAYKAWKGGEITAVEAMKRLDLKPNTFYRRVKEFENKAESSGSMRSNRSNAKKESLK